MTLKAQHIPGWLNVVADKLSRTRPDHPDRVVSPSRGLQVNMKEVASAEIDLFAMKFNNKLALFV